MFKTIRTNALCAVTLLSVGCAADYASGPSDNTSAQSQEQETSSGDLFTFGGDKERDQSAASSNGASDQRDQREPTDTSGSHRGSGQGSSSGGSSEPGGQGNDGETATPKATTCADVYGGVVTCTKTFYACADACPSDSCKATCEGAYKSCADAEYAKASSEQQQLFESVLACEKQHYDGCYNQGKGTFTTCAASCADEACKKSCADKANGVLGGCMDSACQSAYGACGMSSAAQPPSDNGSNGGGSSGAGATSAGIACGPLYECEDSCGGDKTCGQACYNQGTSVAKSQWTQLILCGQAQCDGKVADAASYKMCLQQLCPQQYGTCFNGAP